MNTINNILELQKLVLENLNEDDELFRKELKKSRKWLKSNDLVSLKRWLLKKYYTKHDKTINEVLEGIPV